MSYSRDIFFTPPTPAPTGGYRIRYRIFGSGDLFNVLTGPSSPITINSLTDGVTYEGIIDAACGSGFSGGVNFTITPPFTTTAPATTTVPGVTTTATTTVTTTVPITMRVASTLAISSLATLTGVSGYSLPQSVESGETFTGVHNGFTGAISFTINNAPSVDGNILLRVNGSIIQCITLAAAGSYPLSTSFTSRVYASTDVISIELSPGVCSGIQTTYIGSKSSAGIPNSAAILAATPFNTDPLQDVPVDWRPFNSSPQYCFVAIPDTGNAKATWFVDILNNGTIGQPGDLFPTPTIVTVNGVPMNVYMTAYQTQFTAICIMKIPGALP